MMRWFKKLQNMGTHLSFNHDFNLILNSPYEAMSLIDVGKLFQVWAALTEKADGPKAVLLICITQSPLVTNLVCLVTVVFWVTLYFTIRKQLCKYTEITVYVSVIIVYFRVSIRELYVKFGVIKG